MCKRFLLKHVGNMGDMIFFIPPVLATLKRRYPDCHITFVTAWGFKNKKGEWGKRNQDGFSLHLMMTNPHIDHLIHWHDTKLSLEKNICEEDGQRFPTWNRQYFDAQKKSGEYDGVFELDFGIKPDDNPMHRLYEAIGLPEEKDTNYRLYLTDHDRQVAHTIMHAAPHPRIVVLEGVDGTTMRNWDQGKIAELERKISRIYGVAPLWFGSRHVPYYQGRPLTLRENMATLTHCDVAIGVMSGSLHMAAAVGLPTITLFGDQPMHRLAPAYFLNQYIEEPMKKHRTLLGPTGPIMEMLKSEHPPLQLTLHEKTTQRFKSWLEPGRQSTKSCLAVITVDEVMTVLNDVIPIS